MLPAAEGFTQRGDRGTGPGFPLRGGAWEEDGVDVGGGVESGSWLCGSVAFVVSSVPIRAGWHEL